MLSFGQHVGHGRNHRTGGENMRYGLIVLLVLLCSVSLAAAQVSIGIGLPSVSIGINLPVFPELVVVPAYPVYYAPRLDVNFFFYDGLYWVYQGDNWYASYWYNGPWGLVAPEVVPVFILRIPVRYYRHPPVYFREWRADAPPRWGEHWGHAWEQRRSGWDKWSRGSAPAPAPLPVYQRQYSGDRYPRGEQQQALHTQKYKYQPHDPVVRQHYQQQGLQGPSAPPQRGQQQGEPQQRGPKQQAIQRSTPPPPPQQGGPAVPRSQPPQDRGEGVQKSAPAPAPPQQGGPAVQRRKEEPGAAQREQQPPKPQGQEKGPKGKGAPQEPKQEKEQGQGQGQEKSQEKGQGHNK
jgi:hypothetical protein